MARNAMNHFTLIISVVILFFLFTSLWGFYISVRPPKIISTATPKDLGLAYENISFITQDGLTLRGWFIAQHDSAQVLPKSLKQNQDAKTIILLHGYPADKGNILPSLAFLNKKYNLLLFDFRYLGESQGKYSTAGAKEKEDLLATIKFLKARGIKEVGVWGLSMGGAVALMSAPEAPEIKAIVSESSYARLDLLTSQLYRIPIARHTLGYLTSLWGKIFLKIDTKKVSPVEAAEKLNIPVLIIHSTNDEVIPFSHALLIKEALKDNPRAEFWFQENLFHGQLGEDYQKKIEEFFEKNL